MHDPVVQFATTAEIEAGLLRDGIAPARIHWISNFVDFNTLSRAHIFVLPSLQEGMSNALLEAMACGLPPVATRIGGVEDIVTDGVNGILVKPGDASGLAAGL